MMIPEQYKQTKIYQFIVTQKYLAMIIGVSIVMVCAVLVLSISSNSKKQQTAQAPLGSTLITPTATAKKQGFSLPNLFSLFTPQKPTPTGTTNRSGTNTSQPAVRVTIAPVSSSISSFGGKALTGTTSTGGSIVASNTVSQGSNNQGSSTTGGTSSGGSSSGGSSSSTTTPGVPTPTPRPDILILFENPNGTITNYIPPGTPPTEVRWGRYTSFQDNYAIDYPVNWQIEVTNVAGHQGVAVFAPGTNKNNPGTPYIGFGLTPTYFHAAQAQLVNAFDTDIFVNYIQGTLYTNGPLGSSYIASIFPYQNGNFGLGSNSSDVTFAYVYYFMLHSLRFTAQ